MCIIGVLKYCINWRTILGVGLRLTLIGSRLSKASSSSIPCPATVGTAI